MRRESPADWLVPSGVSEEGKRLVIVIRPAADRRRLPELLRWLKALVPTAILLVAPVTLPDPSEAELVELDCADGLESPLGVVSALARQLPR